MRAARRRAALVAAVTATGLGFAAASVDAAPTWLASETLSTQAPSSVGVAAPGLSANGDVVVLYTRGTPDAGSDATSSQAEVVQRPLGAGWAAPQTFAPTSAAASSPSLTIDDTGRAFGLWSGGTGNLGMLGSERDAGALRFSAAQPLNAGGAGSYPVGNSPIPTSAANRAGRTAVAWIEGTNLTVRRLVVRVREAGATAFGPEIRLTRDTDGTQDEWGEPEAGAKPDGPRVAVGADGTVHVAWSQYDSKQHAGRRAFYAALAPGATAFGEPQLITPTPSTTSLNEPVGSIAVGGDGTVAVGLNAPSSVLQVARRAPGAAAFDAPVRVNPDLGVGFHSQSNGPSVGVDGRGRITASFETGGVASSGSVYLTQQSEPGGAFSTPVALPVSSTAYSRGTSLAVADNGDAVVAWAEGATNTPTQRSARIVAVTREGATGEPSALRTLDERTYGGVAVVPVSNPRVTIAADGDAAVAWGWSTDDAGAWEARFAGLDVAGPIVADGSASATVGTPVELVADARDRFSSVASVRWDLGDGTTADGDAVRHAYAAPGRYEATVVATDEHGNERRATHVVTVEAPTDPGTPVDPVSPIDPVTPVAPVTPSVPTAPTATVTAAKVSGITLKGRTVRLRASKAGKLRVVVQRRTVKHVRKNGRVVSRVAYKQVQRLTVTVKRAGTTSFRVRKLSAGTYRIRVTPTTGSGAKTTSKNVRVAR